MIPNDLCDSLSMVLVTSATSAQDAGACASNRCKLYLRSFESQMKANPDSLCAVQTVAFGQGDVGWQLELRHLNYIILYL